LAGKKSKLLMKNTTDFYLLKKKSLSEGDLFITDYIKTKQRLIKLEDQIDIMQLQLDSIKYNKKIIKIPHED